MRIVTSKQMKQIEQNSIQYQMSYLRLMENAGCAAANFILQTLHDVSDLNCIVFCGKGNNGGDGFVVARKLAEQGAAVTIVLTEGEPKTDDAARMLHIARSMELPIFSFEEQPEAVNEALEQVDVIVDAIYGSGFHGEMDVRRRQLIINLAGGPGATLQSGAMQWTVGDVRADTGVKGAGDLVGKMFRGAVSQDSMIKPEYRGSGMVVCEPTWQHLLLVDLAAWGNSVVLNDGLFLACDADIKDSLQRRSNLTSAVAGNEGLFNLRLDGSGVVALESPCPEQEIVFIDLENDELKVDGNYALLWSSSLEFSVERSGKSLIGSAVGGEGLVNVYRGTGRVMLAPMQPSTGCNTYAPTPTDV